MPFNQQPGFENLGAPAQAAGGGGASPFAGLAQFFSDPQNLEQLGQAAQIIAQNSGPKPIETVNVGGNNLLVDNSRTNRLGQVAQGFDSLIKVKQQNELMKRKQDFVNSVKTIMSGNADNDAKINALSQLEVQHGTDYGLGIADIQKQYQQIANRSARKEVAGQAVQARQDAKAEKVKAGVNSFLGEIESGAFEDQGALIPIKNLQEAKGRALRKFGADYAKTHPEVEDAINKKFGPDQFGYRMDDTQKINGKTYVYIGNDSWLPEKEYKVWKQTQK